jgi:hypothetical protein
MAQLRTIPLHERYSERELQDIAQVVRKVAEVYAARQNADA